MTLQWWVLCFYMAGSLCFVAGTALSMLGLMR
jgi:hypothetical protein